MTPDEMAKAIISAMTRHQTRGLVDDAKGLFDVVIHGRTNLLAVADEVLAQTTERARIPHMSWGSWFEQGVTRRRRLQKQKTLRAGVIEQFESELSPADMAILRLRLRELDAAAEAIAAETGIDFRPHIASDTD